MIRKIIYLVRKDFYTQFGGDTTQVLKTKQFIEKNNDISIDVINEAETLLKINDYDILHIWGINASPLLNEIIENAKQNNKIVIISSIYWNVTDSLFIKYFIIPILQFKIFAFLEFFATFFIKYVQYFIASLFFKDKLCYIPHCKEFNNYRIFSIKNANIIIPNSDEEGKLLCENIDLNYENFKYKFKTVPNAVDIEKLNKKSLSKDKHIPIVFAGAIRNEKYFNALKKLAQKRGNVYFTGKIEEEQLYDLFKRAKVHILPSFRESPGLATLEALMCGCQIVVSNEKYCPIKYYQFDKYGFVCNPYDINSIKNAILEAYNNPKDIKLPEEYFDFYSYENAAEMTYNVYREVLNNENPI